MKTIKTLVAAATLSLLALTSAHAGAFSDMLSGLKPQINDCWPDVYSDTPIIQMRTDFLQIEFPRTRECIPVSPLHPCVIDPRGIAYPLPRHPNMNHWFG